MFYHGSRIRIRIRPLLHPGSGSRIPDPGGKKSTGSRIPDPDPQHWFKIFVLFTELPQNVSVDFEVSIWSALAVVIPHAKVCRNRSSLTVII